MNIELKSNDERLGKYAADGSFEQWPAADVFGGVYEKVNVIVHRMNAETFIVVPPSREHEIETVSLERSSQVPTIPVSQQFKRKGDPGVE